MYKLLLSWDIKPAQDQEYFEFMVREFTPQIASLGIQPIEAWFTVYGDDAPQMIFEGITDDKETMRSLLISDEWDNLRASLLDYVDNYKQKVVQGRSDLQI